MATIVSGDLVVLKSGGPVMTVDTVNTDILDDDKVTGVLCVWFVGEKLERVRFDPRALEPALLPQLPPQNREIDPGEATGEYKVVLDEMAAAMNIPAEADKDASRAVARKPRRASGAGEAVASPPNVSGAAN